LKLHALGDPKRRDHATLDFVAGIFPSCHRRSRVAIHRNDGPLAFEEMAEAKHRWASVLKIMSGGHRDAAMAQLLAGGKNAVLVIDPTAKFLA
jgi:hypothetical protein